MTETMATILAPIIATVDSVGVCFVGIAPDGQWHISTSAEPGSLLVVDEIRADAGGWTVHRRRGP